MKTENLNEGFVKGKANVIENLNAEHCLLAELYWKINDEDNQRLLDVDYVLTRDGLKVINKGTKYTAKTIAQWNYEDEYWENYKQPGEVDTTIEELINDGKINVSLSYIFSSILHTLFYTEYLVTWEDFKRTGEVDSDDYDSIKNMINFNEFLYNGINGNDSYISSNFKRATFESFNNGHEGYYILDFDKIVVSFKDFLDCFSEWFKNPLPSAIWQGSAGNIQDYYFTFTENGQREILIRNINRLDSNFSGDDSEELTYWSFGVSPLYDKKEISFK